MAFCPGKNMGTQRFRDAIREDHLGKGDDCVKNERISHEKHETIL